MIDHFYTFDPFKVRTYVYYRTSSESDYKKLVYYPRNYETVKANQWFKGYLNNNLRVLPWFLNNMSFVKSQSLHEYKVLRSILMDLGISAVIGTLCVFMTRTVLKHQFNPFYMNVFKRNIQQNFNRVVDYGTPSIFFLIMFWEVHKIRQTNHLQGISLKYKPLYSTDLDEIDDPEIKMIQDDLVLQYNKYMRKAPVGATEEKKSAE